MSEELKVEKPKAKKEPVSIKGIISKVIIVILAMLMVGSAYYIVILLTSDKTAEKSSYGSYDGEQVLLEYNNVFYNALMSDSTFQEASMSGNYTNLYSSYYNAFQSQVLYIAVNKLAKEAGISAPQELVNKALIASGVYNDENGKFSADVYNSTDAQQRSNSESYMRAVLPYQQVVNDICLTVTSAQEKEFIKSLASDARNLEYYVVDYNAYPDYMAVTFAKANSDLFKSADVTMVSYASEEDANAAYEELNAGKTVEDLEGASVSSTKASVNTIQDSLSEKSDIDKVAVLVSGLYSVPVKTSYAWTIFVLDSDFEAADLSDKDVLSEVKAYLYKTEQDSVKKYIEEAKDKSFELAASDFEQAAQVAGNSVIEVSTVANNVAGSQLITGISTIDTNGKLTAATADSTVNKEIFTASTGALVGPVAIDGGYIVVKVADANVTSTMGSLLDSLYDYYAYQYPVNDVTSAIFSSDKLQDNFTSQFLTMMLGNMDQNSEN